MRIGRCLIALGVLAIAGASAASAQPSGQTSGTTSTQAANQTREAESKWLVEVHGAFTRVIDSQNGTASLPTTGTILQGRASLSTFMFGEGAAILNQVQTASPIVPLDGALSTSAIERSGGPVLGARLLRSVGRRLAIEGSAEYLVGEVSWRASTLGAVEATRASFPIALERLLAPSIATDAAATSTIEDHQRVSEFAATGGLQVNLKTSGRTIPYLVGGSGIVLLNTSEPKATIAGTYELGTPAQLFATDTVTMRYAAAADHALVFFGGGGLRQALSPRTGFDVDARIQFRNATGVGVVDVTPSRSANSVGPSFPVVNVGALQFSATDPLNGPSLSGVPTFTETGRRAQVTLAAGWFVRF